MSLHIPDNEFEAKTSAFLTWLTEVGVQMSPKMKIADLRGDGRGRGVVALADFEEDEVVFKIGRSNVLNLKTALPTVQSESLEHAILGMPDWLALTTLMICESLNPNSKWAPYLAVLPKHLDSLVFWSEDELAQLQASMVVNKIGRERAEHTFSQHVAPLGLGCDLETCHKVASIIMAYAFDIPEEKTTDTGNRNGLSEEEEGDDLVPDDGEDEKAILSMIPLADMLNADAERNNARLCCDNEDLEMRTIKPIVKGEEIFNDYGQLPRSDLLRRYGYVTDQYAVYDVIEISTSSILSSLGPEGNLRVPGLKHPLRQLSKQELDGRVSLAEREGFYEDSYDLCHSGEDGPSIPNGLLALLFLLLANEETLTSISDSSSSLASRSKLSTTLVGQVLIVLLQMREKEYATTVEDDEKILQKGNLTARKVMALQVRIGEKKILREAIQEAQTFTGDNKRMRGVPKPQEKSEDSNNKRKAMDILSERKKGRSK